MPFFKLSFTLTDAYTRSTSRSFDMEDIDISAALINANLFAAAYQACTKLQLVESRLTDVTPYAGAPEANSNVDTGATFTAQLDTPGKLASTKLPGIIDAAVNPDGTIDLANVAVAAYIAFFVSGLIKLSDEEDVTAFLKGVLDK